MKPQLCTIRLLAYITNRQCTMRLPLSIMRHLSTRLPSLTMLRSHTFYITLSRLTLPCTMSRTHITWRNFCTRKNLFQCITLTSLTM